MSTTHFSRQQKEEIRSIVQECLVPVLTILEMHSKKHEQHEQKFEKIDKQFDKIDNRFTKIDKQFDKIDKRFDKIDGRLKKADSRFEKIEQRLDQHEQLLQKLVITSVDHTERLTRLEEKFDELPSKNFMLDLFDKYMGAHTQSMTEISALGSRVDRHDTEITSIKTHLALS